MTIYKCHANHAQTLGVKHSVLAGMLFTSSRRHWRAGEVLCTKAEGGNSHKSNTKIKYKNQISDMINQTVNIMDHM